MWQQQQRQHNNPPSLRPIESQSNHNNNHPTKAGLARAASAAGSSPLPFLLCGVYSIPSCVRGVCAHNTWKAFEKCVLLPPPRDNDDNDDTLPFSREERCMCYVLVHVRASSRAAVIVFPHVLLILTGENGTPLFLYMYERARLGQFPLQRNGLRRSRDTHTHKCAAGLMAMPLPSCLRLHEKRDFSD